MEIVVIVVILVVFAVIAISMAKGAPDPTSMSEADIWQRMQTESAWLAKYSSLPLASQQSESLKQKHDEKTAYLLSLKSELERRMAASSTLKAVKQEANPILERASQLEREGMTQDDAKATALREWADKNK